MNPLKYVVVFFLINLINPLHADTVITRNGSILIGKVRVITTDAITMETGYAGIISINLERIERLETDTPISTKLTDGTVVTGVTEVTEDGVISVEDGDTSIEASIDDLMASWSPDRAPPAAAGFPQPPDDVHWRYTIGADVTGKRGNSREKGTSIRSEAFLDGADDELKIYLTADRAERNGRDASDELIFGSSYTSYFSEDTGWFISSELERDPFESIDIRASASGGLSFWAWNRVNHSLQLQTGLGYRYELFNNDKVESTPTLDLGLDHLWQPNLWLKLNNSISFKPSLSDFEDFLFEQDSSITMPIGRSRWSIRLGLRNNYKNTPAPGRKKLDTTYYSRLLLNFG